MRLAGIRGRLQRDEAGAALVEFGLVLPLLLTMFVVTVEGGRMLWSYQSTISGVRDAARYLARVAETDACSGGAGVAGFEPQLLAIVRDSADGTSRFPDSITVIAVQPTLICVAGDYRGGPVGVAQIQATLEITFPFGGLLNWATNNDLPTLTVSVTDQARIYGT